MFRLHNLIKTTRWYYFFLMLKPYFYSSDCIIILYLISRFISIMYYKYLITYLNLISRKNVKKNNQIPSGCFCIETRSQYNFNVDLYVYFTVDSRFKLFLFS